MYTPDPTVEKTLLNNEKVLFDELNQRKVKLLHYLIKEIFNLPITKITLKRVYCLKFEGKPNYERYVWDFNKKTEKFIMEWELVFPDFDPHDENYIRIPTIEISAPIPAVDFF